MQLTLNPPDQHPEVFDDYGRKISETILLLLGDSAQGYWRTGYFQKDEYGSGYLTTGGFNADDVLGWCKLSEPLVTYKIIK